jgi:ADP-heptose:LPS heptosyltransferase
VRKLILKCGLAPGDIVMLTAAVRDLHRCHPGRFQTDVRTACPELWEHNPYLTPLADDDSAAQQIDCSYPLINRCNETPYHCLHGFIEYLNERLQLSIRPTEFRGDIHLSPQEKVWYSQVHEVTGEDTPFWLVAAGGKYDLTIKWWQTERYQQVIDHFRGRVQFVQIGEYGHHHPRLEGVIDLRGRTTLRELVRLVYHSQGMLCPVTALMHLAAAVEPKRGHPANRPCVVLAGGREPAHWEAYPDHQFIHTNGALRCCANGGCWRDRTVRLRDGDSRDRSSHLCLDVSNGLPHCMGLITPAEVIHRIELYFAGGALKYLTGLQRKAAGRGVRATAKNPYDRQALNLHSAGMACERFIASLPACPARYGGRGIVICGGGVTYLTGAWVCINMLRRLGCSLPIELWYLGEKEIDARMRSLLGPLIVSCIDACKVRERHPVRLLRGWELKGYAILHSPFREVLLLDADNVPVVNPEFLFDMPQFQRTGAIFWPDYRGGKNSKAAAIWRSCGLRQPDEPELESGQVLVDKQRCWPALRLAVWFNENSDFYYKHLHGDKETFHLAFRKLKQPYALVPQAIHSLESTMCQHDFEGRRIFQHRNLDKWDLFLCNRRIEGFWFEEQCRDYVAQLQRLWDGGIERYTNNGPRGLTPPSRKTSPLRIQAVILYGAESGLPQRHTWNNLAQTDWTDLPLEVGVGDHGEDGDEEGQARRACRALEKSLKNGPDYVLLLEEALAFNRHLGHNLHAWSPLTSRAATLASLFNPRVRELACDVRNHARIVAPGSVFCRRALLVSRPAVEYLVRHWRKAEGGLDVRILRLASRWRTPFLFHAPSLVQKVLLPGESDEAFCQAMDFDSDWKA